MGALTAIEVAADTCTVVRVAARGESVLVSAVETCDPAAFADVATFASALRQARRTLKLPRRARIVSWHRREDDPGGAPASQQLLQSIERAGFRIERVVSPCDALAALARIRVPRTDGAVIWLALNRSHVGIVVMRPGTLLYSHAFAWDSSIGTLGSQARLLQRYSLVSFLAPEVRRAISEVAREGIRVDAVVTCGNLPDLRSLTMPLIEELDLEVETLDSLDGLVVPKPLAERVGELAPALRLACAAVTARRARSMAATPVVSQARRLIRVAALVIAVTGVGWFWYARGSQTHRSAIPATVAERLPTRPITAAGPIPEPRPVQPAGSRPRPSLPSAPRPQSGGRRTPADGGSGLLSDPLPRVTTILVAADRRFAVVDGRIVGVGDALGRRVITRIDSRSVVLREPSGVQIRVAMGGRLIGVELPGGNR